MSAPTKASVSTSIDASPEAVYDLVADVTRMGDWSPECVRCEWVEGEPGAVGSRFKGHNKQGFMKWSTTAQVLSAERGREFSFATMNGERQGTRWTYAFDVAADGSTTATESFESLYTPKLIAWAEKLFLRNRQQQLEEGMAKTLAAVKTAAEGAA